jgi:hypothetical protein
MGYGNIPELAKERGMSACKDSIWNPNNKCSVVTEYWGLGGYIAVAWEKEQNAVGYTTGYMPNSDAATARSASLPLTFPNTDIH